MNEPTEIRNKSRRVKSHILTRYLKLADKVDEGERLQAKDEQTYNDLTNTFAKNVIPRSQEITGEDGEKLILPIYNGISIQEHNSDQADIPAQEENQSS